MEIMYNFVVLSLAVILTATTWRIFNWVWLRPKKLEKILRKQGYKGNSYRVFFGDAKEINRLIQEAKSKPINLSDDILPRLMPQFHECIKKYGKKSFTWLGPRPLVLVSDPEHVREITSKHFHYKKPRGGNPLSRLFFGGLVTYEGEKWAKHRKILNPAFNVEKLKDMLPAFRLSCREMITNWEEVVGMKEFCELDVWPYLQTLTSDVISRTAFGSNYDEGRKIFELQKEQAALVIQAGRQIYVPGSRFLPTARNARMKEIAKQVSDSIQGIINKRMKALEGGEDVKDDLLGILLESNLKEMQKHGNKKFGLSNEEVIGECKLFYFAGQETTSSLLVWTMILLSEHQNWQSSARDEVLQTFGNGTPDYDGLSRLKIVTMILYEVLRLYPPASSLARTIDEETKLGEITLPAGVLLSMPLILLHHDRKLWGDDVKEFKPERFSEGLSKATNGQASFFPFGWGPRICIGQNFAMLEAKMAMAMILQRFSFDLSPSYAHAPHVLITSQPQHGAHLILRKL